MTSYSSGDLGTVKLLFTFTSLDPFGTLIYSKNTYDNMQICMHIDTQTYATYMDLHQGHTKIREKSEGPRKETP